MIKQYINNKTTYEIHKDSNSSSTWCKLYINNIFSKNLINEDEARRIIWKEITEKAKENFIKNKPNFNMKNFNIQQLNIPFLTNDMLKIIEP